MRNNHTVSRAFVGRASARHGRARRAEARPAFESENAVFRLLILASLVIAMMLLVNVNSLRAADPTPLAAQPATVAQPKHGNQSDRNSRRNRGNTPAATPAELRARVIASAIAPLRTRSIFIKGNQTVFNNDVPASNSGRATGHLVGRPESALVFNGVTIVDDEADALIEDTASHRVSTVRPGDPIAGGKVSHITFDDLTYEMGGVAKHVGIGQNLDGVDATFTDSTAVPIAPAAPPTASTPAGNGATTPTAAAPSGVAPTGASPEDILARMKAKRAQELSGQ